MPLLQFTHTLSCGPGYMETIYIYGFMVYIYIYSGFFVLTEKS